MGRGVFVFMHGGSRRVNPSNEVMTGRRYGKMDGVDEGKEGGRAAAAAAALVCCYSMSSIWKTIHKLNMELKLVWGTASTIPGTYILNLRIVQIRIISLCRSFVTTGEENQRGYRVCRMSSSRKNGLM